jgi:catechol 2,3-dioxygenase-like lactoylglutathione lyase family enzyme
MNTKGLAHIAIMAYDYNKTIQFYKDVFDFKTGHHWALPSFKINDATMLISPDGVTGIEIFDRDAEVLAQGLKAKHKQDVRYGALLHLALYVDDVDEIYEKALAHGAQPIVPPDKLYLGKPTLDIYNALFEGLNGEIIEVIKNVDFKIK